MKKLTQYARENRRPFTPSEKALRRWLLRSQLTQFRTQRPFDFYIVDFILPFKRIVIEVDGGYHETAAQQEKDEKRTRYLERKGLRVIRVSNVDALSGNLQELRRSILETPDTAIEDWGAAYGQAAY